MRLARILGTLAAAATLIVVAGCGTASKVNTVVPSNTVTIVTAEPGKTLTQVYGYTPAANLYKHDKIVGVAYVNCGGEINVSECSADIHNRGTLKRPNVYVNDGKITRLEGPHDAEHDDRSYFVSVPRDYQTLEALTREQQDNLLGIMPTVVKAVGKPSSGYEVFTITTPIGNVKAWVSRG